MTSRWRQSRSCWWAFLLINYNGLSRSHRWPQLVVPVCLSKKSTAKMNLLSLIRTLEALTSRFSPKSLCWRSAEYLHSQVVQLDVALNVPLPIQRMQWLKFYMHYEDTPAGGVLDASGCGLSAPSKFRSNYSCSDMECVVERRGSSSFRHYTSSDRNGR